MPRISRLFALCAVGLAASLSSCSTHSPRTGFAPVDDIQMYYEVHGEGTPLILLHGGLGNAENWDNQISAFSRKYKVIALESRGHGRSTFSNKPIGYSLMASDVIAAMDFLEISKAHVLGWSDGGIISLDLAIHHPDRLLRVVAYGANYDASGFRADFAEKANVKQAIDDLAADYQKLSPTPEKWETFLENIGNMWASEPHYSSEQLRSITMPVLILAGESDEGVLTEHTHEMARLIPGAELTFISGTGHYAVWEKPEAFNEIVLEFLGR
jgi:pimeloyl-ACP methyl ester carboxylesterase